jgi:hypothetical protein
MAAQATTAPTPPTQHHYHRDQHHQQHHQQQQQRQQQQRQHATATATTTSRVAQMHVYMRRVGGGACLLLAVLGLSPAAAIPLPPRNEGATTVVTEGSAHRALSVQTGAACYTITGGFTGWMGVSGDYQRMEVTSAAMRPNCGGHSVYRNGDYYLYMADKWTGSWTVGDASRMEDCAADSGNDVPVPSGAFLRAWTGGTPDGYINVHSAWHSATGTGTQYNECDGSWCSNANIVVQECPPPPVRTCADINAVGDTAAAYAFNCAMDATGNTLPDDPAGVTCATDTCTAAECCTVAPLAGAVDGGEKARTGAADAMLAADKSLILPEKTADMESLPLTVRSRITGAACYTITGGFTGWMGVSGDYQRMEVTSAAMRPNCGGHSVYRNGDYYLYMAGESFTELDGYSGQFTTWTVGDVSRMEDCAADSGTDAPVPSGAFLRAWTGGTPDGYINVHSVWHSATGTGTQYNECDGSWCSNANIVVQECPPTASGGKEARAYAR